MVKLIPLQSIDCDREYIIRFLSSYSYFSQPRGWCEYMFSAADGCSDGPDRKAHGDLPQLQWYIQQIGQYKQRTGVQLVDDIITLVSCIIRNAFLLINDSYRRAQLSSGKLWNSWRCVLCSPSIQKHTSNSLCIFSNSVELCLCLIFLGFVGSYICGWQLDIAAYLLNSSH